MKFGHAPFCQAALVLSCAIACSGEGGAEPTASMQSAATMYAPTLAKDINPGGRSNVERLWAPVGILGGKMIFAAESHVEEAELWVTDGTTAGTKVLRDVAFQDSGLTGGS